MRQETFFSHERFRWFKVSLVILAILVATFITSSPSSGASGGSVYGIIVGILCALAIVYLMWFGIRKRSYHSYRTTVKGWLSAHVWIGISLLIAVPLHSGFEMGLNLHGLTYYLMVIVVLSGIWGAVNYKLLAPEVQSHRGLGSMKEFIEQIYLLSKSLDQLCFGKSDAFVSLRNQLETPWPLSLRQILLSPIPEELRSSDRSLILAQIAPTEHDDAIKVLETAQKKREAVSYVMRESKTKLKLRLWLLLHLPMSFALLVALIAHIVVVLMYRG